MLQLSLCMIVRDSARSLRACLASVRPWVDELVVVDTGSRDETPAIAAEFGARLFHFPWCDDFSAARNESLRHARGDWIFWIDSDDTIDAANGRKLRELANSLSEDRPRRGGQSPFVAKTSQKGTVPDGFRDGEFGPMAFVMQVSSKGPANGGRRDLTVIDQVRMFRNRPELRFEGRVHEQIMPAVVRLGGQVTRADVRIDHSGYEDAELRQRKYERDLRLLQMELAERPDQPFALFNLGMTYAGMRRHDLSIPVFERYVAIARGDAPYLRNAYALLIDAYALTGQSQAAWQTCQRGRALFPRNATLLFHEGLLLHEAGRSADAVRAFQAVLTVEDEPHYSAADPDVRGWKARQNLALLYTELGRPDLAEAEWRWIVAESPDYVPAQKGLHDALSRQGRTAEKRRLPENSLAAFEIVVTPGPGNETGF